MGRSRNRRSGRVVHKAELLAQAPEGADADPFRGGPVSPATRDPGEKNHEKHGKNGKKSTES
jgi:hypothetical protein